MSTKPRKVGSAILIGSLLLLTALTATGCLLTGSIHIHHVNDTDWEKRSPKDYAAFTLGGKVFVIGGHRSKELYYTEKMVGLLVPLSRVSTYAHIPSRKVYVSESPAMLHRARLGIEVPFDESFRVLEGPQPPDGVIREQRYYVEFGGAVYCIAGKGPGPLDYYDDVWKSEDGLHWTRILNVGPWSEGPVVNERIRGLREHGLFVSAGRIWLTGGIEGGPQSTTHLTTVWSSPDGVHWMPEIDLPEAEEITNIYTFRGELFIRARLSRSARNHGEVATWKRSESGGVFVRTEGPWEEFHKGDRPACFTWRERLWCAFDSGILVSDDGKEWRELVNGRPFNKAISVDEDSLRVVNRNERIQRSQDGITWIEDGGRTYDYLPARDGPYGKEYRKEPAVLKYRESLWVITGHPSETWRSDDAVHWTRVMSLQGEGLIPRTAFSFAVFRDRMWVLGGLQTKGSPNGWYGQIDLALNDAWSTRDGRVWRREPDAPWFRRRNAKAIVHQGDLYIIGGHLAMGGDNHYYTDIWKTTDGRKWVNIGDYRDLWVDGYPLDGLQAMPLRGSLLLFDNSDLLDPLCLSSEGRWKRLEGIKESNDLFDNSDVDRLHISPGGRLEALQDGGFERRREPRSVWNSAVAPGPRGQDRVFVWNERKLYYSDELELNHWTEHPCRLEGMATEKVDNMNIHPRLVAFRGGLYLVAMNDSQPFAVRIVLEK